MTDSEQPAVPTTLKSPGALDVMMPLCAVFRRHLKSHDLKYTRERADILNMIMETDDVFEADSILEEMKQRGHGSSKATVYRTLKLLQDAGIITPVMLDSRQTFYHLVYGREPLNFLVCLRSGKRIRLRDDRAKKLADEISKENGWHPVAHRMVIYAISPEEDSPATDN
ncbi:MAG: Fur family transcriptional regulator [Phycisphaerales bacterium]|nr:Fur family transcriptional regulator [Phycisphaerales bacterium]